MVKLPTFRCRVICNLGLVLFCWGMFAATALAEGTSGMGYVYPPVVQIGKATEVQFGEYDFTEDMQWFVHDPRVKLATRGVPVTITFLLRRLDRPRADCASRRIPR
ncbi:MAG: hypothetical protein U0894_07385 [Pirellulales bacterium]